MAEQRGTRCSTCGRPRGLEQQRGRWSISPNPFVPRADNPEASQVSNDLICRASIYRNGGVDEFTHLCNECLRVGVRALKVELSEVLGELDTGHDKDAEIVELTARLAKLQYQLYWVGFEHNRMQARLCDLLAHVATSADPEVVRMAEFEVSRGPVTDGVSDPWVPIEERGELEAGEYLVRMKEFITIARWSGAEWQVRIVDAERYYYRAEHITHVHRMGPIRGPGEG